MTIPDLLAGPFPTAEQLTDYRDMPGYAILPSDPAGTPSRATLLREEAIGR
jgi:hypothetical protein